MMGSADLSSVVDRFAEMGFEPKRIVEVLQVSRCWL